MPGDDRHTRQPGQAVQEKGGQAGRGEAFTITPKR